jgi:PAS domain S-box-containing protein
MESVENFKLITENANDLIGILNKKFKYEYINEQAFLQILGYSTKDLIGRSPLKFCHPDDIKTTAIALFEGFKQGVGGATLRFKHKEGHWVWIEARGRTFYDKDRELKGLIISRDVTERKRAEQMLKESEEKYRLISENAYDMITVFNESLEHEYINETVYMNVLGYESKDLIGKNSLEFIHPDDRTKSVIAIGKILRRGGGTHEVRLRHKNGYYKWLEVTSRNFFDSQGKKKIIAISRDITLRKEIEQKLIESEENYRLITENAHDLITILNDRHIIEYMNKKATSRILGYSIEDLINQPAIKLLHPDDLEESIKRLKESYKTGKAMGDIRLKHKEGYWIWLEVRSRTFTDTDKKMKVLLISRDVTERKQAEQKIKEAEEKYRFLFNHSPFSIMLFNSDGVIVECNPTTHKIFGFQREQLIGRNIKYASIIPSKEIPSFMKLFKEFLNGKQFDHIDLELHTKDKKILWIELRFELVKMGDKLFIQGIFRDITEKKMSEQKLKESEAKHRLITENANDLIFLLNEKLERKYVNEHAFLNILGYSKDFFIRENMLRTIHPDDLEKLIVSLKKSLESRGFMEEIRVKHKSGHFIWLEVKGKSYIDKNGKRKIILIAREISERKEAEQKLIESEEKYRFLFNQSPFSIILFNTDGVIVDCNPTTHQLFGYERKELIGRNFEYTSIIDSKDLPLFFKFFKNFTKEKKFEQVDLKLHTKDKKKIWVNLRFSIVKMVNRLYIQVIFRDITEKKEIERIKSNILQRFSHEFKTPLVSIKGYTDLLLNLYIDRLDDEIIEILEKVKSGELRLEVMIREFIESSKLKEKKIKLNLKETNLSNLIVSSLRDLSGLKRLRNHTININIRNNLTTILDGEKFKIVLTNLLINAMKFTPSGGSISIGSKVMENEIIISIEDNGIGLTEDEKPNLFKQFGKIERYGKGWDILSDGTGMGLFISKEIIELHRGRIWVESEGRNKGSTFYFSLPLQ